MSTCHRRIVMWEPKSTWMECDIGSVKKIALPVNVWYHFT